MRKLTQELPSVGREAVTRAFVDISFETETGALVPHPRRALAPHNVIGRAPGVAILLDHDTVSRKHAEIYVDPFGRWWVGDLQSTNGTSVNGERVQERLLRPMDRIDCGDYRLVFVTTSAPETPKRAAPSLEETLDGTAAPSWLRTLRDIDPPQVSATQLGTLMAFSRKLLGLEDAGERMQALCELLVSSDFHGRQALVARVVEGEPTRVVAGPTRPAGTGEEAPYVSRSVLKRVVDTKQAVLGSNLPQTGTDVELTMSAEIAPISTIAVPISSSEGVDDVLYGNFPPHVARSDWLALVSLAGELFQQSESAWLARRHAQEHAAIERELETARIIQHALVPKLPSRPGLDIAVGFEPCRWVGGDYADIVQLADGRILCTVADVCGKGLQAALVTFSIHTMIRTMADFVRGLPEIVDRLNRHLCGYLPDDSFVTMIVFAIDPKTGEMEYVNAGHLPCFVFDRTGGSRTLDAAENPPLGIGLCTFRASRSRMAVGDALLLYTDGLTELRNSRDDMLGEDALREGFGAIYTECGGVSVERCVAALDGMLDEYRGGSFSEDDRAFIVARRTRL
jgi:serine phosphatase RsbU (regulator of sigma subunit)/pSer/pThr/pTyr-binding forkhead associated (FHA) protein